VREKHCSFVEKVWLTRQANKTFVPGCIICMHANAMQPQVHNQPEALFLLCLSLLAYIPFFSSVYKLMEIKARLLTCDGS